MTIHPLVRTALQIATGRAGVLLAWVLILPLVGTTWGPVVQGAWAIAHGLAFMSQQLDFGVGIGVQQRLAVAFGGGDASGAARSVAVARWLIAGQSILAACIAISIGFSPPPTWLLGPGAEIGRSMLVLACLAAGVQFPAQLYFRRLAAIGAHGGSSMAQGAGALAGLVLAGLSASLDFSVAWAFAGAVFLPPLVQLCHGMWMLEWRNGPSHAEVVRWRRDDLFGLLRDGGWFSSSQLTAMALTQGDVWLIAAWQGPVAAGGYAACTRILNLPLFGQSAMLSALWPAMTTAWAAGDSRWMTSAMRRARNLTWALIITVPLAAGFLMIAGSSAGLLVDDHVVIAYAVVVAAGLWSALHAQVLQAIGELRLCATVALAQAVVALGLSCVLGAWGTVGIVASLALASLILPVPFLTIAWKRRTCPIR